MSNERQTRRQFDKQEVDKIEVVIDFFSIFFSALEMIKSVWWWYLNVYEMWFVILNNKSLV